MGNNLVVVEQETLKDLISDAVFAAMQDYKRREKATESIADASELPDAMTAEETLPFLASLGYRTTMRSLYILTHRHEIPYAKFGPVLQKVLTVNNLIGYGTESKRPRHSKRARRGKN